MAEEEPKPSAEAVTEASEPTEATANGEDAPAKDGEGGGSPNGKRPFKKEDQVPIEELYDLSKPIPRVEKPKKDEFDSKLQELSDEMAKFVEERRKVQEKIDAFMEAGKSGEMSKERDALQQLRRKKGQLIDEKKALRAKLDDIKNATDKLVKDRKDTRSNIRFSTLEEIEAEIAKLQRRQETTSMSLQEEKKLIKEMDALKASKAYVKELKSKDTDLEDTKEKRKAITMSIGAKDKEIDAVTKEIDDRQAALKSLSDKETDKRGALDSLFQEREKLKKMIGAKAKEKDALRADLREKNNQWYNYQRAVKAQKKIQYEAEKKKREEEREEYLRKLEEEEAKKIPYEEEQTLCEYLANYLERTYLSSDDGAAEKVAAKKEDVVAVKEDPFAGFKPVKKDEEEYFGKGKGKKKRNRAPKKQAAGPFTLNVDTFEQFGWLGLNPPTSLDAVSKSVSELREKKEWYSKQPRGSVPTAAEIRKSNERTVAKLRQANAGASVEGSSGPAAVPKGKFALSDDDFAPLGKGASASVDTSQWGQKPASEPAEAPSAEDPVPAEAAEEPAP